MGKLDIVLLNLPDPQVRIINREGMRVNSVQRIFVIPKVEKS